MKTSRYSDSQILSILKQAAGGVPVLTLGREYGMGSVTFYKWRGKYGGMDASLMAYMKELEKKSKLPPKHRAVQNSHQSENDKKRLWEPHHNHTPTTSFSKANPIYL